MDTTNQPCILLLDLPHSALGGIDLLSFTTTPRFQGIRNIPLGFHFVFTSPTTALSIRQGAWFHVDQSSRSSKLWIKKWDPSKEELLPVDDEPSILRWHANIGSIWKEGLTPYRQSASGGTDGQSQDTTKGSKAWKQLTLYLTAPLLARITRGLPNHWNLTSASSASMDADHIPGLSNLENLIQPEKELNFLPINLKQTWREGATGRERTDAARDRSWALDDLITRYCANQNETDILGELQFTFLMVLTLNNNSCLEQWKRILNLLLTCRAAVPKHPKLFVRLFETLQLQLEYAREAEGGLFDFNEDDGSMLRKGLRDFKRGLQQESDFGKQEVFDQLEKLEDFVKTEFGWDLQSDVVRNGILQLEDGESVEMDLGGDDEVDELGEYAPTIVELTPEQVRNLEGNSSTEHPKQDRPLDIEDLNIQEIGHNEEQNGTDSEEDDLDMMDSRY